MLGSVLLQSVICLFDWTDNNNRLPVIEQISALMFTLVNFLLSAFQRCSTSGDFFLPAPTILCRSITAMLRSVLSAETFCCRGYHGLHRLKNAEMYILSGVSSFCQCEIYQTLKSETTSFWQRRRWQIHRKDEKRIWHVVSGDEFAVLDSNWRWGF